MTDRNELRRLAEAVQQGDNPAALSSRMAFVTAASPDVVRELLDEIGRLKGECDFFSARSEEERTNRGLAEKDFHDAMELVRKYSAERDKLNAEIEDRLQAFDICHRQAMENGQARIAAECERDQLRSVLEAIAAHNPAVTHGWAEQVREMARNALGGEPITDYRAVAVRLKLALQELESRVFEDGAPDDVLEETQGILTDPEVEKL